MKTKVEDFTPHDLSQLNLEPRGRVFPSPMLWKHHIFYQILPDRFSDGREAERPMFDYRHPEQYRTQDKRAWMSAGLRFTGGTLQGIRSKLDYLQGLGITGLWLNPAFKQRADLQTYHGYAIQNFLDIDPRFGTIQDLRDLIDDAHDRGMVVVLDVVIDHTGNNWFYGPDLTGITEESLPYRYEPPYSFAGWRSGTGECIPEIQSLEDGCWPKEFQSLDAYNRRGAIVNWSNPDPMDPNAEFRRGDFFDLKKLDGYHKATLEAIVRCYQYWIAVTDCDGFRIDAAKHIPKDICAQFSFAIARYAQSIGKENFLLVGEITDNLMSFNYLSLFGSVFDRALTAVLDINNSPNQMAGAARGTLNPMDFFQRFRTDSDLARYIQTGRLHVSILDDHDMSCKSHKQRFAAHNSTPHSYWQSAHAVGIQLLTPGIPCIYYGTEQAFDGNEGYHDYSIEPNRFGEDRYIREDMFGGPFGAFQTTGCHFFNPEHPTYLRIAAIARIRNGNNSIGRSLRMGICYPRETSFCGYPFQIPGAGELFGWSRILSYHEIVMVMNTHGLEPRGADVTVDGNLNPPGSKLRVLYRADWTDEQLKQPPTNEFIAVEQTAEGRAYVRLSLPPAGMVILG
ncbi:alpha-amylase [Phormidium sp. LEGE 05292]|uniref:alpha-amylase family glycosyl hydrolase n=1 Tax=[Phormidium] sp. LEGE 05292 TaxID=767427 RepID=UPI00187DEBF1|nr:alpha-amylase family glycosyl hydrolase [Phormidium sp. LEGE 05292]MBE9226067.1 alpha-amylase [Phormidium sp. LEGE 05292]